MGPTSQESAVARPPSIAALDRWLARYQQVDPGAPAALNGALSPALLRFCRTQDLVSREEAGDLLPAHLQAGSALGVRECAASARGWLPPNPSHQSRRNRDGNASRATPAL
jgi:hypothetical protein